MPRIFNTLAHPVDYCYEEKRSRFIAHLWPVANKEEGFAHFEKIKRTFPDARHHCWAYLIGDPEQALTAGFNDDGEPGGTAGKPMLHVLTQRKVGNVFAVVVRYFGGIKLGAGGLTRAYGQAISGALDLAQLQQVVPHITVAINTDYPTEDRVRHIIKGFSVTIDDAQYGERVTLIGQCPEHSFNDLKLHLGEHTSGSTDCRRIP
jgi:uncharacterized YigZ family protein